MKKKVLFIFLVLSLVALPLFGACAQQTPTTTTPTTPTTPTPTPAQPAEVIKWKVQSTFPAGDQTHQQAAQWAKRVTEASNGRLDIAFHASGEIVGMTEVIDAAHAGTVDAGFGSSMFMVGKVPNTPFFVNVPVEMDPLEHWAWLHLGGGLELWREMYAPFNFYQIPMCVISQECLGWFNKPVRTLEDFKGLKFRTIGYWGDILKRLGASVVTLSGGEVYEAIQRGVIDAGEVSTPATDKALGLHEVAEYVMFPGIHQMSSITELWVNNNSWQKLPKDLKILVEMAANEATLQRMMVSPWTDAAALEFFKEYGTEIIVLSPEVQSEIKRIWDELAIELAAKDPFIAKVWKSRQEFRTKWEDYADFAKLTLK